MEDELLAVELVAPSSRIIRSGRNCDAGHVVEGDGALECFRYGRLIADLGKLS